MAGWRDLARWMVGSVLLFGCGGATPEARRQTPPRLVSMSLRVVDRSPGTSSSGPPCAEAITIERDCDMTLESPRREATVPGRSCAELFALLERRIAPRMRNDQPCGPVRDASIHLELRYDARGADGTDRRSAQVAGCLGEAPWQTLFDALRELRCAPSDDAS